MEPISIFLGASFLFLVAFALGLAFGYQIGYATFHYENLKNLISNFKKNTISNFTPRQKVVILNSKDSYLPDPDEEEEPK